MPPRNLPRPSVSTRSRCATCGSVTSTSFSEVSFQIGPIDFTLNAGELVFITGGNGSGKSTFLRVLSGLYPPDSGEIMLDGMRVDGSTRDHYRKLMSAIFFDYHLFRRLYGIPEPEPGELDRLLAQFRLGDKTGLSRRRISHARICPAASAGASR